MLAGLARDGGLYLPAEWPQFSKAEIAALKGQPYVEVAYRVMRPFVGDAFDEATFRRLIGEAYASFETPEVAPLKPLGDERACTCSSCSMARRSPSRTWRCSCSAACSTTR